MSMAVARVWGYIKTGDHRVMRRLNRWRSPRWFRIWMILATRLGDGWGWYALGVLILFFGGPYRFVVLGSAGLAVTVGILLFRVLKQISRRKRPCELEPHCWARVLPPDQFSFPSGHSITAFAIAVCVGLFYPQLQVPLLFLAASIAASRIVLGMHFLSDVVAGSLLGTALGYSAFRFFG